MSARAPSIPPDPVPSLAPDLAPQPAPGAGAPPVQLVSDTSDTPAFPSIPPETMEGLLPPGGLRGLRKGKAEPPAQSTLPVPEAPDEWVEAPTVRISREAVLDEAALSEPTATSNIADLAELAGPARADLGPTLIQSATPAPAQRRHRSSPPSAGARRGPPSAEVRAAGLRFASSLFGLAVGTIVLLLVIVLVVLMR